MTPNLAAQTWQRLPFIPQSVMTQARTDIQRVTFLHPSQREVYARIILDGLGWGVLDEKKVTRKIKQCLHGKQSEREILNNQAALIVETLNKHYLADIPHVEIEPSDNGTYLLSADQPIVIDWQLHDLTIEQIAALHVGLHHINRFYFPVTDYMDLIGYQEDIHDEAENEIQFLSSHSDELETSEHINEFIQHYDNHFEYLPLSSYYYGENDLCGMVRQHLQMGALLQHVKAIHTRMNTSPFKRGMDHDATLTEPALTAIVIALLQQFPSRYSHALINMIQFAKDDWHLLLEQEYDEGLAPLDQSIIILDKQFESCLLDLLENRVEHMMQAGERFGSHFLDKTRIPDDLTQLNTLFQILQSTESLT